MAEQGDDRKTQSRRPRGRPRLDAQMAPQILDAAERIFARRGTIDVSIRDIAAEAGLPHSAIYRYFDSKQDVLQQVLLRGRARQVDHESAERQAGRTTQGALEWLMNNNRAYGRIIARAALEGETASSLGLDTTETVARRSLQVLEDGVLPFEIRTDHDPRMVIAAVMALSLGWMTAEEWVLDSVGLAGCDLAEVRAAMDEILASMMAMGKGRKGSCD